MIVADENLPAAVVEALREEGLEVWSIREAVAGAADVDVLRWAAERGALLITADKDFGELVYLRRQQETGVVLLRLGDLTDVEQAAALVRVMREHGSELAGCFTVVAPTRIRMRRRSGRSEA